MSRYRKDTIRLSTALLGFFLVLAPGFAAAVNFPGPILLNIFDEATSALVVPGLEGVRQQLVVGTGSGFLKIVKAAYGETSFTVYGNFPVGGRIVSLIDWEGLPPGETGLVVSTLDPDRVVFLKFTLTSPYFEVAASVDLEEDPGQMALLGLPDGERDELAVSLPGVDQVVLIRRVDPGWSTSQILDTGDQPFSLVGMQLDADPESELLCANGGPLSGSLGRYDRQEDGSYLLTRTLSLDCFPRRARAYDWDQDGTEELIVTCADSSRILALSIGEALATEVGRIDLHFPPDKFLQAPLGGSVQGFFVSNTDREIIDYFRLQEGSVEHGGAYFPACPIGGLLQCDFNGDGIGDLICLGGTAKVISVMYGKPDFGYWGYEAISLTGSPGGSVLADFDGDGERDLVVCGLGQPILDFFPGLPGGGLHVEPESWALGFLPGSAVDLQLDGDPARELALHDLLGSTVRLLKYSPSLGFETLSQVALGSPISGLLSADIDDDGLEDLLGYSPGSGGVPVFFGLGGGEFSERFEWSLGSNLAEALPLDLNADGLLDLAVSDGQYRVWTALNIDGRALGEAVFVFAGTGASLLAAGDLDGDGDLDLVVGNTQEGTLTFLENDGLGGLVRRIGNFVLDYQPKDLLCADLDNNGRDDVLINLPEAGTIGVVYPIGDWQFSPVVEYPGFGDVTSLLVEDINADGTPDFLILDRSGGIGYTMFNTEMTFVAVAPSALEVHCEDEEAVIRIRPDRPGPWILEFDSVDGRIGIVVDGTASRGTLDYEQGVWSLTLGREDFPGAGEIAFGRRLNNRRQQAQPSWLFPDPGQGGFPGSRGDRFRPPAVDGGRGRDEGDPGCGSASGLSGFFRSREVRGSPMATRSLAQSLQPGLESELHPGTGRPGGGGSLRLGRPIGEGSGQGKSAGWRAHGHLAGRYGGRACSGGGVFPVHPYDQRPPVQEIDFAEIARKAGPAASGYSTAGKIADLLLQGYPEPGLDRFLHHAGQFQHVGATGSAPIDDDVGVPGEHGGSAH